MIHVTLKNILKSDLCIGCGLCSVIDEQVQMLELDGRIRPSFIPNNLELKKCCPALGYNLKELGKHLFNGRYKYELGFYEQLLALRSASAETLENASSGGVITEIAKYALARHYVDGIICTKYDYSNDSVRPVTYIASTYNELLDAQGSKYCPTSTLSILREICKYPEKKYILIGTPCQIAGFRLYSECHLRLKDQIVMCISNFCGGYRDFRELDYFIHKVAGFNNASFFRHRGGGQPGGMCIKNEEGDVFSYPYPEYAKLSPFVKVERCSLCMDAVGELADISCGDAWLESFKQSGPWSIAIVRSENAKSMIDDMIKNGFLTLNRTLSEDEVITSQMNNITSKKYRQYKRIKIRSLLFKPSPNWYDDFPIKQGALINEAKIYFSKERAKSKCKSI